MFKVEGQVVAVTGAASGIGFAYAEVMSDNGAIVNLIDINPVTLATAVEALRSRGAEVHGEVADATDPVALRRAFDNIVARHGRVDTVFANAGISGGPGFIGGDGQRSATQVFEHLSVDLWRRVLDTNLTSIFLTIQCVVPILKRQGGGRIIVTSSVSAFKTETQVSAIYTTSKGAVAHLVRQAAIELAAYKILVNAIAPGPVITNIAGGRLKSAEARRPSEEAAPLGRICEPSDLQGVALLLASPASNMMTGVHLLVDGGMALGRAD